MSDNDNNYCISRGYDYYCEQPLPRSAFNTSGPLCQTIAQYLYDPANCDAGYWCGCSSTNASLCIPSNIVTGDNATLWGGHFTTKYKDGTEVVFTGVFETVNRDGEDTSKCTSGFYCPGSNNSEICVDLCPPKFYCPTPGKLLDCDDGYCPVGSVIPKKCEGLQNCNETGLRRFKTGSSTLVMLVIILISVIYLFAGSWWVIRSARNRKVDKMAAKRGDGAEDDKDPDEEDGDGGDDGQEATGNEEGGGEGWAKDSAKEEALEASSKPWRNRFRKKGGRRRSSITAPEMTIDIECEKLRLTIPGVGTIMRGVSAKLPHGKLTAIMGPSGAGKTTFLSLMSGKVDCTEGSLKVNGVEEHLSSFRNVIGFVPQEDIMLRELSVEENITHSALMRLPTSWKHQDKMARVEEILEALKIDHIRDSVVGDEKQRGISGGQRKRVNIGLEVVTKPSLLCLDEPTSGLDSTTSYTVVNSLKEMARAGANVITVLHQPKYEVFELFDNVLLLGKGGICVYYGSTKKMSEYFAKRGFPCPQNSNPADFYMDVLSGIIPHPDNPDWDKEDLFEEWACAEENPDRLSPEEAKRFVEEIRAQDAATKDAEEQAKKRWAFPGATFIRYLYDEWAVLFRHLGSNVRPNHTGRKTPGMFAQFYLLFKRANLQRLRTKASTILNIILMVFAGAVIPGLVPSDANLYVGIPKSLNETSEGQQAYLNQNVSPVDEIPGTLLYVYFFLLMISCLSVNVYGPERVVFFRETAVGQVVVSYWMAKTLETLLWLPILTCSFVFLGYSSDAWLIQPLQTYWVFLFIALVGFYGFGMLASLLVGVGSAALLALVFGIIVIVGFSGTVTAYGDQTSGAQSFANFWFLFWTTQGLATKEYDQYTYAFDITRLNEETPDKYENAFGVGQQIVGAGVGYGFDLDSSYVRNVWLSMVTAFYWYIIVLWTLKAKDHKNQR